MEIVEAAGKCFEISPLVLEDIVNTSERPKIEDYDNYLFLVLKALHFDQDKGRVKVEQVCLVITQREVLSFQEERGGLFDNLREHLRRGKGRLRRSGSDYLAYALIDTIVDNYYSVLEEIGERIEFLEDELVDSPDEFTRNEIYRLKRELIFLRKTVWPLREVMSTLYRQEHGLIQDSTVPYLRDTYDHTMQVIETIEIFRRRNGRDAGYVHVQPVDPHEFGDEGVDHDRHYFHPSHFHCRSVRDEFPGYAGAGVDLWLPVRVAADGGAGDSDAGVFQAQGLVVGGKKHSPAGNLHIPVLPGEIKAAMAGI